MFSSLETKSMSGLFYRMITSFIIHNLGWQARALVPAIFVSTRYTWFRVGSCPLVPFPKRPRQINHNTLLSHHSKV